MLTVDLVSSVWEARHATILSVRYMHPLEEDPGGRQTDSLYLYYVYISF